MADAPTQPTDPLIDALVDVLMTQCADDQGAVNYPQAAAAFAQLLAEMIGPQPPMVRKQMHADFRKELERAINLASLRASVIQGGKAS